MAEVVLKITGDNTSLESSLSESAQTIVGVSNVAKKANTEIKQGIESVAASYKKANDVISDPKPSENQKRVLNATQQLKKEMKEFEAAAIKAGEGTAEFARNIAEAGKKKAELKDLKEAIAALDPDAVAKTFLGLASSVAGGFTVAQSAIALTGAKSEELEKTLLKVQAAQGLLAGLQQLANTQDELGKAKIIILNKLNTLEVKKGIVAVQGATIAQRLWNLVMASNPIGLLVAGLTALAAIVVTYISQTESAKRAEEARATAIDGTIIKSKELRDAYNESIVTLKEVENQYKVLRGEISELDATLSNIAEKNKIAVQEIQNETNGKLAEAGGFWTNFANTISASVSGYDKNQIAYAKNLEIIKDGNDKLKANDYKFRGEQAKSQADADKKAADKKKQAQKESNDKYLQAQKEFEDALKSIREKARDAEIQSLEGSERIEAERKLNQEAIDELEKSLIKKGKLLNDDFKISEEQQKQFGIIRNKIDKDANDKILAQRKDFYEKSKSDAEQAEKDAIDFATKEIEVNQKTLEESNKAKVLLTKEGTKERLDAEVSALETERDFILKNTELTNDQRIIVEQEALQKIADLQNDFSSKNKFDIFSLLGIKLGDAEKDKVKQELEKIFDISKQFVDKMIENQQRELDERKKINDEILSSNEDKLSDLLKQLELELDANKQGLASNVDAIRAQIEDTKNAKLAALEEEKRIADEQEKIKRRQLIIDSLGQASSLLSAGATLFATGAFKGPVGIIASIATIAAMVTAFLALKNQIQQVSGFKEGGYTGDYGINEVAGSVHGQEFVSTAKTTKKHRPLLEALHKEDYSHLTIKDLTPLLAGTGVTFNKEVLQEIKVDQANYTQRKENQPRELVRAMELTNKKIDKFYNHIKNKPSKTQNPDGSYTEYIGSTKRTIRKK